MATLDKLLSLLEAQNIADELDHDKLMKIGDRVCHDYKADRESRKEWEDRCQDAIKLAKQIVEHKTFPWDGASNVVFPLLTTAANVFASRTYPEIIRDDKVVKVAVFGDDADGMKRQRADRISSHMSYQRLVESDTWEPDTDKLLHILPIVGVCFRKVYFDTLTGTPQSDLCNPEDIVIHHDCPSIEKAQRITHRYFLTKNEMIEKMRSGMFRDLDLETLDDGRGVADDLWDTTLDSPGDKYEQSEESYKRFEILEQHAFYDLDGDGYEEPYILIVHKGSKKVLGIFPRFDKDEDINYDDKGEIINIKAEQYFVDYHFLPSPDGGFYSLGYGHLLYPLNEAINSIMNQLVDAGTLANTQSGLVSRQLKIKGGTIEMQMGKFTPVDSGMTGRLSDSVYPFPFKEPSPTLLQLLGLMIDSAKEMAAINDVLTGQALPQNAPASSVAELATQGMKLFNSIAKRLYRSLKKEFKLLYNLNRIYLSEEAYFNFHDKQLSIGNEDYEDKSMDIAPVADPNMSAEIQRSMKAQALQMIAQNPSIQPYLKGRNVAEEIFKSLRYADTDIPKFVVSEEELAQQQQQQGPSPEEQKMMMDAQKMQQDYESKIKEHEIKAQELQIKLLEAMQKYELKLGETDERQLKARADAAYKDALAGTAEYDAQTKRIQAEATMKMATAKKSGDKE